ncbi:MAG TPA: helix-turn-helix domain-containing protein [Thermosynergistes sp.]|nr:helix-turn-helix domain-containing protein [Thermosynergistes sp.]HQE21965.1 helix-turn-helix domain-containing protein [Thermosynergistes sp.]
MASEDKKPQDSLEKEIGLRIKLARISAGLKQKELAEMIGMHPMSLSSIESGRRGTTVGQLLAIARALNVPIGYILGGREGETDELTAEMEKLLGILAERDVEIVANLRGVISKWEKLSEADRKFMVDTLSYALRTVNERAKA